VTGGGRMTVQRVLMQILVLRTRTALSVGRKVRSGGR
jgi:hypothetical protein